MVRSTTYDRQMTCEDNAQPVENFSVPFYSANFHVHDNNVLYGNGVGMTAPAVAGSTIFLEKGNLNHVFFKNATPGSVAKVSIVATVEERDQ